MNARDRFDITERNCHGSTTVRATNSLILNCDSYRNYQVGSRGNNGDGFGAKAGCGTGNVFRDRRAWESSDDGWDLFESDHAVVITNCWTWHNGDKSLYPPTSSFSDNGNGFKLGGNGSGGSSKGTHVVMNCVAFNHTFQNTTGRGFDQNSHKDGVIVLNCVSFSNKYNYIVAHK